MFVTSVDGWHDVYKGVLQDGEDFEINGHLQEFIMNFNIKNKKLDNKYEIKPRFFYEMFDLSSNPKDYICNDYFIEADVYRVGVKKISFRNMPDNMITVCSASIMRDAIKHKVFKPLEQLNELFD